MCESEVTLLVYRWVSVFTIASLFFMATCAGVLLLNRNIKLSLEALEGGKLSRSGRWTPEAPHMPGLFQAYILSGGHLEFHVVEVYERPKNDGGTYLKGRSNGKDYALSYFDAWWTYPVRFKMPTSERGMYTETSVAYGNKDWLMEKNS